MTTTKHSQTMVERLPRLYDELTAAGVEVLGIRWDGFAGDDPVGRITAHVGDGQVDAAVAALGLAVEDEHTYGDVNAPLRQVCQGPIVVFGRVG